MNGLIVAALSKFLKIERCLLNIKDVHIPGAQLLFTIPVCKVKDSDPRSLGAAPHPQNPGILGNLTLDRLL